MPILYSKKEAADMLGISISTLDRYWKSGKLTVRTIGDLKKFSKSDIDAFSDACAVPATTIPPVMAKAGKRRKTTQKTLVKYEQGSPIYDYGAATLELSSLK
jgi:excisionase family DNA binding protein